MSNNNNGNESIQESTILVADDDKDIRNFLKFKLQKIGYKVVTARDGLEAIERAKSFLPDLILLDMMMPFMDGLKACDHLKNHNKTKNIPVVFVTAVGDSKGVIAAYKLGADDYLVKPIDIIIMSARIKSIIETKRLKEALKKEDSRDAAPDNPFDFRHLFERVESSVEICRKESIPLSLIQTDIDYLKIINSEYGFKSGDVLINKVRKIVSEVVANQGTILYSNSDKLFLILPGTGSSEAQELAERIFDKIEEIDIPGSRRTTAIPVVTNISLSMGVVAWGDVENVSSKRLLDLIRTASRNAKEQGRGKNVQYQFFNKQGHNGENMIEKNVYFHRADQATKVKAVETTE